MAGGAAAADVISCASPFPRGERDAATRRAPPRLDRFSGCQRIEIQRVRAADPSRGVAMIAQLVSRVRMQEHVERAVMQHEPRHDVGELRRLERDLIRPRRMRPDEPLVKAAELHARAEAAFDGLAKRPRRVAARCVEIHVGMPAGDGGDVG
ncbi:hypothetical protein DM53_4517 [Burkholderia mallei]|nr:hypothetical protein DM53_4517 [Burkholderia mallei]